MSAAFEMQYAPIAVEPFRPPIDEMIVIEPPPRASISGATMPINQWLATMLLSRILRNASSLMPPSGP